MTVIDCSGSGRDRGLAHGESARERVRNALARWEEAKLRGGVHSAGIMDYAQRFLGRTSLIGAISASLPDLNEEMHGIATGANVPYELIAAYNLMDEQWWYDLDNAPAAEPGCSLVALAHNGETLLAQNMDLPAFMDGSQIVLRIRAPGQPEVLALSSAGLIGLTGVNQAGVAVCVNTLLMLRHDAGGLPVAAVFRHAIAQSTAAEAAAVLRSVQHASGQHYAVADRKGVVGLECSAGGCSISSPHGGSSLTHTNHPLASGDIEQSTLSILEQRGRIHNSRERLAFLDAQIGSLAKPDDAMRILADRSTPICISPLPQRPSQTFASVVFEMSETTRATFCLGKPGEAPWEEIEFTKVAGHS